jgi:hypothetical protein
MTASRSADRWTGDANRAPEFSETEAVHYVPIDHVDRAECLRSASRAQRALGAEYSPTGLDKRQFDRWFAAPGTWLTKREVNAV